MSQGLSHNIPNPHDIEKKYCKIMRKTYEFGLRFKELECYSEKCSHFYQGRKMGKKEIKKQKASKGEGRARSWAKAGASVPRTGELRPGEAGAAPTFPGGKGKKC